MAAVFIERLFNVIHKKSQQYIDKRSEHIFYKIVDRISEFDYKIQCINTKAVFESTIKCIVFDRDILNGLHPIQSCFVGIEYAKLLKEKNKNLMPLNDSDTRLAESCVSRYGCYSIRYQNRIGNICFVNIINNNEITMDPRDIALSEELISEFDAIQAFHIGLFAGLKLSNSVRNFNKNKHQHLRIVK